MHLGNIATRETSDTFDFSNSTRITNDRATDDLSTDINSYAVKINGGLVVGDSSRFKSRLFDIFHTDECVLNIRGDSNKNGGDGGKISLYKRGDTYNHIICIDSSNNDLEISTSTITSAIVHKIDGTVIAKITTDSFQLEKVLKIKAISSPGTPVSGYGNLYLNTSKHLVLINDFGTSTNILPSINEDNMVSDSALHVPTQQSVKAYVDAAGGGGAVSAVANGVNNRITTFSGTDSLNGEANLTFDGSILSVLSTTKSTNTITGAFVVKGGVGIQQDVHIGGSLTLSNKKHCVFKMEADTDDINEFEHPIIIMSQDGGTKGFEFGMDVNNAAFFKTIQSDAGNGGAQLQYKFNFRNSHYNANVDKNIVVISPFFQSTSTNTGALLVYGGAGIQENLNVGGNIVCDNMLPFIDEDDDMVSDSVLHVPTQQSVKAYVDANAGGGGGEGAYAKLQSSTQQFIINDALVVLTWDTEEFDPPYNCSYVSNNRIQVTNAGYYQCEYNVDFENNANGFRFATMTVNTTTVTSSVRRHGFCVLDNMSAIQLRLAGSCVIKLAALDEIYVMVGHTSTTQPNLKCPFNTAANSSNYFSVTRIGGGAADMLSSIDEDNMVSDSALHVPTQQSVKAYVDASSSGVSGYAKLSSTTQQTISSNLITVLTFSTQVFTALNMTYGATNNRIIVAHDGYYHCSYQINFSGDVNGNRLAFMTVNSTVSGSTVERHGQSIRNPPGSFAITLKGESFLKLNANDAIYCIVFQTAGTSINSPAVTTLSGANYFSVTRQS